MLLGRFQNRTHSVRVLKRSWFAKRTKYFLPGETVLPHLPPPSLTESELILDQN